MEEFKQWHDEELAFYRETKLYFSQCSVNGNMMLSELLALTTDTAGEDFTLRGLSYPFLLEQGYALLASRVAFKFFRIPGGSEKITIKTWEEKSKGFQLVRRYDVLDEDGKVLIAGNSTWLVVNPETRRILKPNTFVLRPLPEKETEALTMECGKIHCPENIELWEQRKIRYSDLDANGHMNNSRYGNYIVDCIPKKLLDEKKFTDFRLNYAHEAVYDETLDLYGANIAEENKLVIVGKNKDDVCFEAELYYE